MPSRRPLATSSECEGSGCVSGNNVLPTVINPCGGKVARSLGTVPTTTTTSPALCTGLWGMGSPQLEHVFRHRFTSHSPGHIHTYVLPRAVCGVWASHSHPSLWGMNLPQPRNKTTATRYSRASFAFSSSARILASSVAVSASASLPLGVMGSVHSLFLCQVLLLLFCLRNRLRFLGRYPAPLGFYPALPTP